MNGGRRIFFFGNVRVLLDGVCVRVFFFVGYRSQSDVACFFFSLGAVKKSSTRIHALV